jgi:hypothetical protein
MCKDLDRGGWQVALRREIDGPKGLPERGCQRITSIEVRHPSRNVGRGSEITEPVWINPSSY